PLGGQRLGDLRGRGSRKIQGQRSSPERVARWSTGAGPAWRSGPRQRLADGWGRGLPPPRVPAGTGGTPAARVTAGATGGRRGPAVRDRNGDPRCPTRTVRGGRSWPRTPRSGRGCATTTPPPPGGGTAAGRR